MEKVNLPPFYVGQKVVANRSATSGKTVVKKGDVFSVLQIKHCCGSKYIVDVGLKLTTEKYCQCADCSKKRFGDILWCAHFGFSPLQEQPAPLLTFTQIKETEKEEILILN